MDLGGGNSKSGDEKPLEAGGNHQSHGHRNHHLFDKLPKVILVFSAMALACLVLYHSAYTFQLFPTSFYNLSPSSAGNLSSLGNEALELKKVLEKTAMVDKTVIITTLNEVWAEANSIFELFLESFRIGNQTERLLNNLVVIAWDKKAYDRCLQLHTHCYALSTPGIDFSGEADFMTGDYLKMMWRRIDFLYTVLAMGYNFVFTDADIMWFREPFSQFYLDADFQIACDFFYGKSSDLHNLPNGGFNYVKSNSRTIKFYKFWYTSRQKYPTKHDQDVLNIIKFDPFIRKIGLKIRFLDTAYFGGFCQPSKDFNQVCTMHANCCAGLDNKIYDLRIMLEDWRKYASSTNQTATRPSSWTVPQHCGAASFGQHHPHKKNGTQGTNG